MMADPSVCHPEITRRALGALGETWVGASAGLDIGRLSSSVIDESRQNCRDCVERSQGWFMTEGCFHVTALYIMAHSKHVLEASPSC